MSYSDEETKRKRINSFPTWGKTHHDRNRRRNLYACTMRMTALHFFEMYTNQNTEICFSFFFHSLSSPELIFIFSNFSISLWPTLILFFFTHKMWHVHSICIWSVGLHKSKVLVLLYVYRVYRLILWIYSRIQHMPNK